MEQNFKRANKYRAEAGPNRKAQTLTRSVPDKWFKGKTRAEKVRKLSYV